MQYEELGKRVRAQRIALGWTQEYLAREIGVSTSFVGHIERGTRKASLETLVQLANSMKISTDELLRDSLDAELFDPLMPVSGLTQGQRLVMRQILTTMQDHLSDWDSGKEG